MRCRGIAYLLNAEARKGRDLVWPTPSLFPGMSTIASEEIVVSQERDKLKTAVFVHGLLGSGRNWRGFAKQLAQIVADKTPSKSPDWRFVFVDLRNHGQSAKLEGFEPPHDIPSAAKDLAELVKVMPWGWPEIVIGHSLGGKVALDYAQNSVAGSYGADAVPPKQLWVLDSVPGKISIDNTDGEVERVLATLKSLPNPIPSRRWLQEHMIKLGFTPGLSAWLGSNLKRIDNAQEEMNWIFNLDEAYDMFRSYREHDYWSVIEEPPRGMKIGVVRASKSDRWAPHIVQRLEKVTEKNRSSDLHSGVVSYHILENAGHWVHTDNPLGLAEILAPSFVEVSN